MKNKQTRRLLAIFGLLAGLLGAQTAVHAENAMDYGNYTVHYNALGTDVLPAQVAKTYGITRSKNRGMINITVLKKVMGTTGQPVTAKMTASATNLTGQYRDLDLREVREGTAIYYISEFRVSDQETLDFTIKVQPQGQESPFTLSFRQQFYTR
ncbi:MAG TPA: DUF4426 domain-containing protein [Chromatiaceae bacterium]|jgi:hypothetical protein|nr:DUF4426 domain-containing protein [Chromatiaceae bacterium]HIO14034.1 DUF4426 domain-containing protein [Chromatiales bacterium]